MTAMRNLRLIDRTRAGPDPGRRRVRVAIATRDMKSLNAHFGSAPRVRDLRRDERGLGLVEAVGFGNLSDETGSHAHDGDDRIGPKVEALRGCHLLFCLAIGGPAAAKVVAARIIRSRRPCAAPGGRAGAHARHARRHAAALAAQGARRRRRRDPVSLHLWMTSEDVLWPLA